MKKDYIIVALKYSKSNGIRTLYRLADALVSRGYNAYMFAPASDEINCNFLTKITKAMKQNAIVVYPELIYGNPLNFNNVVRYVLYYPGKLGGEKKYNSQELIITFSSMYYQNVPVLSIPCLDKNIFYKDDSIKKDIDCYFVYKGGKWKKIEEFKNMVEINKNYPAKRQDLGDLLRRTKTLYSYDDHSLLLDEAIECGCKVKIVRQDGFEDYVSNYSNLVNNFDDQIEYFIKITQELDNKKAYKRNLSSVSLKNRMKYYIFKSICYIYKTIFNDIQRAYNYWFRAEVQLKLSKKNRT